MKLLISLILLTGLIGSALFAESKTDFNRKFITKLSNQALIGIFAKSECYPECGKWYSLTREYKFTFDGTNRIIFEENFNFKFQNNSNYYEFRFKNNKYQYRIWNYEIENEWSAMQNYTLVGNVLTLTNFLNETYILTR